MQKEAAHIHTEKKKNKVCNAFLKKCRTGNSWLKVTKNYSM